MTLDELRKEVMPFGKYKGSTFDRIPLKYFWWMLQQDWLRPMMRERIEEFLNKLEEERRPRRYSGIPRSSF